MKNSFLKIAFKNIINEKVSSAFNIIGFSLTLTTVLLISFYVINELSYDTFHKDYKNIFRSTIKSTFENGEVSETAGVIHSIGPRINEEVPSIESFTRIYPEWQTLVIKNKLNSYSESEIAYVDPGFFSVFSFQFIEGNSTQFIKKNSLIINKKTAIKYFGNKSGLNEILTIKNIEYRVIGIIEDFPPNSHFDFNLLIPISSKDFGENLFYQGGSFYTYFKIKYQANQVNVLSQVNSIARRLYLEYDERKKNETRSIQMALQPLNRIHLHSHFRNELKVNGNLFYVKINIFLAILLLLISTINFINTTTVISEKRSKSIGIQKVLGASRIQLIQNIILEIMIPPLIALIIAILLAFSLNNYFMPLLGFSIPLSAILSWKSIMILIILGIIVILLSTVYPALYLSKLPVLNIMSGYSATGIHRNSLLYKILLCFQFASSIFLIISLLQITQQINYLKKKDLGFNKNNVLVFTNISHQTKKKLPIIQGELCKLPFVKNVSSSKQIPGERMPEAEFKLFQAHDSKWSECNVIRGDCHYIPTLELNLLEGRNFRNYKNLDKDVTIINESAAKAIGKESLLGTQINLDGKIYSIIGIVQNFHIESLHNNIKPIFIVLGKSGTTDLAININSINQKNNINRIKSIFNDIAPEYIPFSYFLKDRFNQMYKSEDQIQRILLTFCYIAIIISIMGVWAFSSLFLQKKQKEIAIRKVLGANNINLFTLLIKNFLPWILIAFIISSPLVFIFISTWLDAYIYKIEISILYYIYTIISVIVVVIMAVIYHYLVMIKAQPVTILKKE
ncbi:FtsX-like permease family protein [Marinifilum caeruleilacunae]|uniref:ABC transporter permease n=1 Tax=Marinifilum caeruleilacunae TaxID=2499076 RepID=A0ABX1WS10_9BACT|nr:ABC transporter permease [Marinifilum caeruleilacunae]NOU58884.1 ABC transporter permease [Marinifilum caeruleilacunae]